MKFVFYDEIPDIFRFALIEFGSIRESVSVPESEEIIGYFIFALIAFGFFFFACLVVVFIL